MSKENKKPKMIFHHPLPLNPNATSASGIRPLKMIEAFEAIGYEVVEITGYGAERRLKIKELKQRVKRGEKFDFMYSESSTQPTLLTEKNHIPKYPFLDFNLFKFCKQNGIKIGLFYRDIYWLFPDYAKELSSIKRGVAKLFYWYDLLKYRQYLDILYLPSMQMSRYIPLINKNIIKDLPPAHSLKLEDLKEKTVNKKIELLYIGGLNSHYQMHILFDVLKDFPNIHLTLCTREIEWQKAKSEYNLSSNITIVHKSRDELKELYKKADIALIYVKPKEYWEFAMPVKLFEYIGYLKPIIVSKNTLSAKFVEANSIGWSIEYKKDALTDFFNKLSNNIDFILEKRENIKKIHSKHNWQERALQVKKDLTQ